jgi:hypothetical protein
VRTLWAFAVETSRELGPLPSSSLARPRLRPKRSLYDFMDETTDLEKIAEQAKEPIAGAAQDLKETASSIADAARPAAEAAWKDTKSELSRLNSICEGEALSDASGSVGDRHPRRSNRAQIKSVLGNPASFQRVARFLSASRRRDGLLC